MDNYTATSDVMLNLVLPYIWPTWTASIGWCYRNEQQQCAERDREQVHDFRHPRCSASRLPADISPTG